MYTKHTYKTFIRKRVQWLRKYVVRNSFWWTIIYLGIYTYKFACHGYSQFYICMHIRSFKRYYCNFIFNSFIARCSSLRFVRSGIFHWNDFLRGRYACVWNIFSHSKRTYIHICIRDCMRCEHSDTLSWVKKNLLDIYKCECMCVHVSRWIL